MPSNTKSPLPGLSALGSLQPLKPLRRPPVRRYGPRHLQLASEPERKGGPGEPPADFITAHTSFEEWWVYWAMAKVLRDPSDPRKGPYVGGATWSYQTPLDGGRVVGGQVVDFVYLGPRGKTIGLRLQTERYHIMVAADVLLKDFFLKTSQHALDQIIDLYSQDWLDDQSGKAVCAAVANGLKGIQNYSPNFAGTANRVRAHRGEV